VYVFTAAGLLALMYDLPAFTCGLSFLESEQAVSLILSSPLPPHPPTTHMCVVGVGEGEGTTWDLLYSACFQTITSGLSAVIPVVCYSNADTQKISILKENRGKSGVYR